MHKNQFRPFTKWLAHEVEKCLINNESGTTRKRQKGAWETKHPQELQAKVLEEWTEFMGAWEECCLEEKRTKKNVEHLIHECIDLIAALGFLAASQVPEMQNLRRGRYVD